MTKNILRINVTCEWPISRGAPTNTDCGVVRTNTVYLKELLATEFFHWHDSFTILVIDWYVYHITATDY